MTKASPAAGKGPNTVNVPMLYIWGKEQTTFLLYGLEDRLFLRQSINTVINTVIIILNSSVNSFKWINILKDQISQSCTLSRLLFTVVLLWCLFRVIIMFTFYINLQYGYPIFIYSSDFLLQDFIRFEISFIYLKTKEIFCKKRQ